jgi:hypothetical protein
MCSFTYLICLTFKIIASPEGKGLSGFSSSLSHSERARVRAAFVDV